MDLIFGPKGKKWHQLVRTGVYGARTTRDFPTAITSTDTDITGAAYALVSATHEIDLNGAPAAAMRLVLDDGATGNDKIAVKIYGSVDGTNYTDAWHERITGSIDPIINDYGAVNKVLDLSGGLRKVQIWGIRTYTGAARSSCQMIAQIKYEAVAVNAVELIKKTVEACFDLTRGHVGARVTNWPNNSIVPYNFVDTTNLTTASSPYYYPSATGMSLAGVADLSLSGKFITGAANTLLMELQVLNDEDLAGDWQTIWFLDTTVGPTQSISVGASTTRNFSIAGRGLGAYTNFRIKVTVVDGGAASNTVIIKGNSVAAGTSGDIKGVLLSPAQVADLKIVQGGNTLLNTSGASGANLLAAGGAGLKHRIWKLFFYAGASTSVTLSDGAGVFATDASGKLELDFNPVGDIQGTAATAITATTGDASAWTATVIYKDE